MLCSHPVTSTPNLCLVSFPKDDSHPSWGPLAPPYLLAFPVAKLPPPVSLPPAPLSHPQYFESSPSAKTASRASPVMFSQYWGCKLVAVSQKWPEAVVLLGCHFGCSCSQSIQRVPVGRLHLDLALSLFNHPKM